MNPQVWLLVVLGVFLGFAWSFLVILDVYLKKAGDPTESTRINGFIKTYPFLMLAASAFCGMVWGALIWHFVTLEGF